VWADSGGRNWVSRHLVPADVLAATDAKTAEAAANAANATT
jgi:hypothetical protein